MSDYTSLRDMITLIRSLSAVPSPFILAFSFSAKYIGLHLMFLTKTQNTTYTNTCI